MGSSGSTRTASGATSSGDRLGRVLLTYAFRPTETLTSLLDRPAPVIAQWDRLARVRHVVGLAGADAHARLGFREASEPYQDRVLARVPSYDASFRAFSNHVVLDGPLTGEAAFDARHVLDAIRKGRVFTSIDGLATLGHFEAKALSGTAFARVGEYLDLQGPAAIDAQITAPAGTTLVVVRDGQEIYDARTPSIRIDVGAEPAAYRIEAHLPAGRQARSIPWIVTNPIYVGLRTAHAAPGGAAPPAVERTPISTRDWRAESSTGSTSALASGALEDGTPALVWRVQLADGGFAEPVRRAPVSARPAPRHPRPAAASRARRPAHANLGATPRPG